MMEKSCILAHMIDEKIKDLLRKNGIRLNTDAGQHFLVDDDVLAEIICAADLLPTDRVFEIGPGIGVLTAELVKRAAKVTSVEIDPRFPPLIHQYVGDAPNLEVVVGNALQTPTPTDGAYKVVANIPYHITSPLLHHLFLESPVLPTSVTFLIQREVAENIASKTSDSILTVLTRIYGEPSLLRLVSPDSFLPPPQVDSAVLHIKCYAQPKVDKDTAQKILNLAKHGMSKRRKMLSNSVGELPGGMEAMAAVGIDPKRRPQTLKIDEWIALERELKKHR
jgi:16S rRNA (adenine1518-N6/adenine1519-N6)-dimethyltransferase